MIIDVLDGRFISSYTKAVRRMLIILFCAYLIIMLIFLGVKDLTRLRFAADLILQIQQVMESHPETVNWDTRRIQMAMKGTNTQKNRLPLNYEKITTPFGATISVSMVNSNKIIKVSNLTQLDCRLLQNEYKRVLLEKYSINNNKKQVQTSCGSGEEAILKIYVK